ncbi:AI-2E family transporter [Pseudoflavonifractor capillosus]|uniref:AI-2E family transporter n=1 Tax=Pseudoflavonifractor capillosus TaxID=106588 RepID=UPI0031FA3AA3
MLNLDNGLFRKLILLITYAVALVVVIVKIDVILDWGSGVLLAFRPIFIGFAIAFILSRPCNFFVRVYARGLGNKWKRFARPLAVTTAYVILFAAVGILISLVVPELTKSIQRFIGNMNVYAGNLQDLFEFLVDRLSLDALANLNLSDKINEILGKALNQVLNTLTGTVPHLISATSTLVSAVVTTVISFVFSVYMLSGGPKLTAQCRRLVVVYLPEKVSKHVLEVVRLTADTFTKYVSGQLIEACILGSLCFVGMVLFHFDYAPLISVVIGVSALIPVAGAYIGAVLAALLLAMISPIKALWFLIFLAILQQLEGNLIYPRVVGTSLGLPGIWVLAAVTVGSSLLGFVGLVVSVPVTAVVYTILKYDLRKRLSEKEA